MCSQEAFLLRGKSQTPDNLCARPANPTHGLKEKKEEENTYFPRFT